MTSSLKLSVVALGAALILGSCAKENLNSDLTSGQKASSENLKAGKALGTGVSASGQGTLVYNSRFQHFSFNANKSADGVVSGNAVLHSPGQNASLKADVLCLTVTGKEAVVSLQVTQVTGGEPFGIEVGSYMAFKVVDNGEGSKSTTDQFSDVYGPFPAPVDCNQPFLFPLQNIVGGNIQVKQ